MKICQKGENDCSNKDFLTVPNEKMLFAVENADLVY